MSKIVKVVEGEYKMQVYEVITEMRLVVFWLEDLLETAQELQKDLKRFYIPERDYPPHILALEGYTDYHAALNDALQLIQQYDEQEKGKIGKN